MLAIVRHGQTDLNLQGRLQGGGSDWPLNDTGYAQARAATGALRATGVDWTLVVSSPQLRARTTAEIVAEGLQIELGPTFADLVERDYGELEEVDEKEAERLWPGKSEPTVEPLGSVVERGLRALDLLRATYRDRDVVVSGHGTLIRYTLSELVGRKLPHPANASVSLVEWDGGWRVRTIGGEPV